jgi:hypothetical protein
MCFPAIGYGVYVGAYGVYGGVGWRLEVASWSGIPSAGLRCGVERRSCTRTDSALSLKLALHAARPNPFAYPPSVHFDLPVGGHVRLEITEGAGRHVRALVDGALPPGAHLSEWDGRGDGAACGRVSTSHDSKRRMAPCAASSCGWISARLRREHPPRPLRAAGTWRPRPAGLPGYRATRCVDFGRTRVEPRREPRSKSFQLPVRLVAPRARSSGISTQGRARCGPYGHPWRSFQSASAAECLERPVAPARKRHTPKTEPQCRALCLRRGEAASHKGLGGRAEWVYAQRTGTAMVADAPPLGGRHASGQGVSRRLRGDRLARAVPLPRSAEAQSAGGPVIAAAAGQVDLAGVCAAMVGRTVYRLADVQYNQVPSAILGNATAGLTSAVARPPGAGRDGDSIGPPISDYRHPPGRDICVMKGEGP